MEAIAGFLASIAAFLIGLMPGVLAYEAVRAPMAEPTARILFTGDIMMDRSVRAVANEKGGDYIFSCIDETLAAADLAVANLEGPITSAPSRSIDSKPRDANNFTFTFPTSTAELLYRHGIRLVNIGNNHIENFGDGGVAETRSWLAKAGVGYFGDPGASAEDGLARIAVGGVLLSFVSWSDWTGPTADETVAAIEKEKAAGRVVVVYAHWGDEYVPPPQRVKDLAHRFIDAGAEIVIGSHPHIVQESEEYKGKHIYYSLGNFIFDQYWRDEVRNGLVLSIEFTKDGVAGVREIPVSLERDRRTCLAVD